jgi:hypothetical protein
VTALMAAPALADHQQVVGGQGHLAHQVAGDQHGAALGGQRPHEGPDPVDAKVVEGPAAAGQRLGVEEGAHLADGRRQVAVAAAVDGDRAPRRRVEAQDHPHGGGLPGAVRAEEAGDQAGPDGERQVVDGGGGAVALDQAVGFDHRSNANGTARSQ